MTTEANGHTPQQTAPKNRGGRPTTHGGRKMLASLEGKNIDPALLEALAAYVTEIAEDDGGIERQSRRRQRLTRRTAMLEMVADTLDAYILKHGVLNADGEPLSLFKLYGWITNSVRRHYETLGLERRHEKEPERCDHCGATFANTHEYFAHQCPARDNGAPADASDDTQAETPTGDAAHVTDEASASGEAPTAERGGSRDPQGSERHGAVTLGSGDASEPRP